MSQIPFTVQRRVKWGETDPAQIVYTPRFLDYAVEAMEAWFAEVVGVDWFRLRVEHGMGTPMAHASLDFFKPLFPHDPFSLTLLVSEVGRSSIKVKIEGRNHAGERAFEAVLVAVLIDAQKIKSRSLPPDFRARIENYKKACIDRGLT